MNLSISGHHLEITPPIREYVTTKLERVRRHFDRVIDVNVFLSIDNLDQKAEMTLHVAGKEIFAESTDADLYAAIDTLIDRLDRQVIKYKSKRQEHDHACLKHQPEA